MYPRILIVENEESSASLTRETFEVAGYETEALTQSEDVRPWLEANLMDLVVVDSTLPGLPQGTESVFSPARRRLKAAALRDGSSSGPNAPKPTPLDTYLASHLYWMVPPQFSTRGWNSVSAVRSPVSGSMPNVVVKFRAGIV